MPAPTPSTTSTRPTSPSPKHPHSHPTPKTAEQIRLRDFCNQISETGAMFIASNSDPKAQKPEENFFDTIYSRYFIKRVSATRMINSNPGGRGSISEIMISNVANI